ncbi:MAG: SPFH domain-containing protein [Thermodesulfobacteriota bacterium]
MKKLTALLALILLGFSTTGCIMKSTGATEVGVRTKKLAIFGESGVEDRIYPPGSTYFFLPFVNDWHTFDTKLQNLEMTADVKRGDRASRDDLLFKTVDGNDISLDVIVAYRLDPQKAPYVLQNVAENDQQLREKVIRTVSRSLPRDIFGELKTEEFYVADLRQAKAEKARQRLQEVLKPMGLIVERVLPKDYRFNPAYQKAIEGKKVADQQAEKNKSATRAAVEEFRRKVEEAKGEVNKMVAQANGEYDQAKIEADAYYERQRRIAEAIQVEGEAEAEGIAKLNAALAEAGGEVMVRMRMSEALQGKRIMVLPLAEGGFNLKTTNINELIEALTSKGGSGGGKK